MRSQHVYAGVRKMHDEMQQTNHEQTVWRFPVPEVVIYLINKPPFDASNSKIMCMITKCAYRRRAGFESPMCKNQKYIKSLKTFAMIRQDIGNGHRDLQALFPLRNYPRCWRRIATACRMAAWQGRTVIGIRHCWQSLLGWEVSVVWATCSINMGIQTQLLF